MYMPGPHLILRTIYMDPEVDDLLRDRAEERKVSKASLLRAYLQAGMKAVKSGAMSLSEAALSENVLVLRTCHIDPKVDTQLRVEAFHTPTSKNDLYRRYISLGIRVEAAGRKYLKAEATTRNACTATVTPAKGQ